MTYLFQPPLTGDIWAYYGGNQDLQENVAEAGYTMNQVRTVSARITTAYDLSYPPYTIVTEWVGPDRVHSFYILETKDSRLELNNIVYAYDPILTVWTKWKK